MPVTIDALPGVAGSATVVIPDDLQLPLYQASASPTGRYITSERLRRGTASLENKTLETGCAVGAPATHIPVYASLLRVGTNNESMTWVQHAEFTWDAGSIAAGAAATQTVTVTGAVNTDMAIASARANGQLDGLILTARVTSSNTVTLRLFNVTASPIDPISISFDILVIRMS